MAWPAAGAPMLPDAAASSKARRPPPRIGDERGRYGGSELDGDATEVVAAHQVEVAGVGVGVQRVVRVQERRLLVAHVVHAEVDARVDRLDVVADLDVVVRGRTVVGI